MSARDDVVSIGTTSILLVLFVCHTATHVIVSLCYVSSIGGSQLSQILAGAQGWLAEIVNTIGNELSRALFGRSCN